MASIERWTFDNDTLFDLVRAGKKRGTCSLWRVNDKMSHVGDISEIYDSHGNTVRIKTVSVHKCRFCDVDADWAITEGEGDRSLGYWRTVHRVFFTKINPDFKETDYLTLEEFVVLDDKKFAMQ